MFSPQAVYADFAPGPPDCSTGYDYRTNSHEEEITCGFLIRTFHINLGNFENKLVILKYTETRTTEPEKIYTVVNGEATLEGKWGKNEDYYFAIDKEYFTVNGGLNGIFVTQNLKSNYYDQYYTVMTPKNESEYESHSYDFVIPIEDTNLKTSRYKGPEIIDGKYFLFLPHDPEIPTVNLECGKSIDCKQDITYVPQAIQDGYVVLVQSKKVNSPRYIVESSPNPTPTTKDNATREAKTNSPLLNATALISPEYLWRFLLAFCTTLLLELIVLSIVFRRFIKKPQVSPRKIIWGCFIANSLTLPFVWFVFPFILSYPLSLILSELFAFAAETFFYSAFFKLSFRKSLALSLVANLLSFAVGWFVSDLPLLVGILLQFAS